MKALLYLGLDPARYVTKKKVIHYPIIEIQPISFEQCQEKFLYLKQSTHVILTSRSSVKLFFEYAEKALLNKNELKRKNYISVGLATAGLITEYVDVEPLTAKTECQEGVVDLLQQLQGDSNVYFYPHSSLARSLILRYLEEQRAFFQECSLYRPVPAFRRTLRWSEFDEIVFTSPSTVDAFFSYYNLPSTSYKLTSIGPVTEKHLNEALRLQKCKKL